MNTDFVYAVSCCHCILVSGKNSNTAMAPSGIGYLVYGRETTFRCLQPTILQGTMMAQDVVPSKTGLYTFSTSVPIPLLIISGIAKKDL